MNKYKSTTQRKKVSKSKRVKKKNLKKKKVNTCSYWGCDGFFS